MSTAKKTLIAGIVAALVAAAGAPAADPGSVCPRQKDACVDRLLADMERHGARLGCDHNAAFALLYRRTTEGIRDAIRAGEFGDRPFWNQVTTAFGRYYLDAFKEWRRGDRRSAPKAWRIAFRAARRQQVSTLGDLFLGINAHVNRDLAYVYHRLSARDYDDHLHVNTVLARTTAIAYPEIIAELDPTLAGQRPDDPNLELDVLAWRERAWTNAARLAAAPDAAGRRAVAAEIERHSVALARRIKAAFPATRAANRARNRFCADA